MRIVKCEKIFLSQNESDTWKVFEKILEDLERGSEDSNTLDLICEIKSLLSDLWEEVEDVD